MNVIPWMTTLSQTRFFKTLSIVPSPSALSIFLSPLINEEDPPLSTYGPYEVAILNPHHFLIGDEMLFRGDFVEPFLKFGPFLEVIHSQVISNHSVPLTSRHFAVITCSEVLQVFCDDEPSIQVNGNGWLQSLRRGALYRYATD